MKENMPEISFERSMNHNYMILSRCSFFGKSENRNTDYRTKMLLENRIPGSLPVTHRLINGESRYYYEINSLQSLDRLYDKAEIRYGELRQLLSGCVCLFERLEEYLLDGTQIIIKPELIYIDVERMEPYFVCYPDYEGDVRISFMEFVDELLTRIDHTDEHAVMLGYQIYRYTRNPNYVISEIGNMMDHVIVNMAHREKDRVQDEPPAVRNDGGHHDRIPDLTGTGGSVEARDCPVTDPCEEDADTQESAAGRKTKNIGDLIGGIFCILVSLCSGAIILGARVIHSFQLSGNSELYLYGATAMAVSAAVLFFTCFIKKRRQDRALEPAEGEEAYEDDQFYTSAGSSCADSRDDNRSPEDLLWDADHSDGIVRSPANIYDRSRETKYFLQREHSETTYLGDGIVEERVLCGRMNGKEVNISLDRLPMTVGKLANVADFVINDAAVSKMHARFEEHDGRIYVRDLNSTNGTVRNGVLLGVNQSVALEPGDRIRFGRTCFIYC